MQEQSRAVQLDSFWGLLTNPGLGWQYAHNMSGAAITGAFVLAAMGAYFLLLGRHIEFAKISVRVGVVAFLLEERLDLRAQRRVRDLVEIMVDRADEEPLAVGEQEVDAVRDRGRDGIPAGPVLRDGRQVEPRLARDRDRHGVILVIIDL